MFNRILLGLIIIIVTANAFAQEKMTIAVLDLQPKGTSKILAGVVTYIIRSEMIKTGLYIMVERNQMDEIMKEQSFQLTGCVEQSCAVQIGKILSAKKVLVGEIGRVGKSFMITTRIVDVEKGVSEFAANERAEDEDGLDPACSGLSGYGIYVDAKKNSYITGTTDGALEGETLTGSGDTFVTARLNQ